MKRSYIFCLLYVLTNFVAINGDPEEVYQCNGIVSRVAEAVEKTVGFFSREYRNVNLDALLGLRMAEGQLIGFLQALREYESGGKTPVFKADVIDKVDRVRQKADDICTRAIPHVKRNYPQDYNQLGRLVTTDGFWDTNTEPRLIDKRLLIKPSKLSQHKKSESLQEATTDNCFSELLGSSKSSKGSCSISKRCWDLMSAPGYAGYSLTHQILYFQISLKMECSPTIEKRFDNHQFSAVGMFDELCANEYIEAEGIAKSDFPEEKQDLFMEQGLLCGLLGYKDFYRQDWLDEILSWQDESGCFKNRQNGKGLDDGSRRHRTKRRETIVTEDGCLSHKTAVALGFLSTYLRLSLDIVPDCFFS